MFADKEEMKNVFLNSKNYEEINATIKQITQKKNYEKVENTSILEELYRKL